MRDLVDLFESDEMVEHQFEDGECINCGVLEDGHETCCVNDYDECYEEVA